MEIDLREIPEGEHATRVLTAVSDLEKKEVLTLLAGEDPKDLMDSVRNVLGDSVDMQKMRWGTKNLAWILHVKKSLKPSAYQPD